MLETNIPYFHCRNGIYYYRYQSVWKSLRTSCKKKPLENSELHYSELLHH
jgi:hypothetical protein